MAKKNYHDPESIKDAICLILVLVGIVCYCGWYTYTTDRQMEKRYGVQKPRTDIRTVEGGRTSAGE